MEETTEKNENGKNENRIAIYEDLSWVLIIIGVLVIIIFLVFFLIGEIKLITLATIKADKFGQFGDIVGGVVGSLWALAGVMLFYAALKKQIEALEDQRKATKLTSDSIKMQIEELQLQREEFKQTREVFKEQEKTMKIQQFENTFFNLLKLLDSTLNNIDLIRKHDAVVGIYTTEEAYRETVTGRDSIHLMLDRINRIAYDMPHHRKAVIDGNKIELEPYLNLIKQILIRIDNCPFDDKNQYLDILLAQLTKVELELIKIMSETDLIDDDFLALLNECGAFRKIDTPDKPGTKKDPNGDKTEK